MPVLLGLLIKTDLLGFVNTLTPTIKDKIKFHLHPVKFITFKEIVSDRLCSSVLNYSNNFDHDFFIL